MLCCQETERVRYGGFKIPFLPFSNDIVLLALLCRDLQLSLESFAGKCEAAGIRISASKSEAMVLS